jgi:hypothetical protein
LRITVKLVDAAGEPIKSTTDVNGFIARCAEAGESWRVLGRVDEYGDTWFGTPQMRDFLADWDDAWSLVESFADENCWRKVRDLAVECDAGADFSLHFVGD